MISFCFQSVVEQTQPFDNPPNRNLWHTAVALESQKLVPSALPFFFFSRLQGSDPFPGGFYEIRPGDTPLRIFQYLKSGVSQRLSITIPKGLSNKEVKGLLLEQDTLKGDPSNTFPEGSLLPGTYEYVRGVTRNHFLQEMANAQAHYLGTIKIPGSLDKGSFVILASIIEKEATTRENQGLLAGLFLNKLKASVPLESPETLRYGLSLQGPSVGKLSPEDRRTNSPYNLFMNLGLPPTPICNPSISAFEAILNPKDTKDLYFETTDQNGIATSPVPFSS